MYRWGVIEDSPVITGTFDSQNSHPYFQPERTDYFLQNPNLFSIAHERDSRFLLNKIGILKLGKIEKLKLRNIADDKKSDKNLHTAFTL